MSSVEHRVRPTILLASGRYFDLLDPRGSGFDEYDVAHALANICRFNGHCREFYSVAQHSVLVSHVVPPLDAFAGLMHDAAEAFLGDVTKPLKGLLPDYKTLERRVELDVFARFGLPPELPQSVKDADLVLLRTEQRDLMHKDSGLWTITEGFEPLRQVIKPWPPKVARVRFLKRFRVIASHA